MTDEGTTERARLMDIAADHMAEYWYRLEFPRPYIKTRIVNLHQIAVIVCNGEEAKRFMDVAGVRWDE